MAALKPRALAWGFARGERRPRQRARYCLPWWRPATTRSSISGQPADGGEHQGDEHLENPSTQGLAPPCPPCMAPVAPLFHPLPSYADAAGSSLHQRGGTPHPELEHASGGASGSRMDRAKQTPGQQCG